MNATPCDSAKRTSGKKPCGPQTKTGQSTSQHQATFCIVYVGEWLGLWVTLYLTKHGAGFVMTFILFWKGILYELKYDSCSLLSNISTRILFNVHLYISTIEKTFSSIISYRNVLDIYYDNLRLMMKTLTFLLVLWEITKW
jgi:hypothetical protein